MSQQDLVELRSFAVAKAVKQEHDVWSGGEVVRKKLLRALVLIALGALLYALVFVLTSHPCWQFSNCWTSIVVGNANYSSVLLHNKQEPTSLDHIVFGIAATAEQWSKRQEYIKLWWRPGKMRGFVWFDRPIDSPHWPDSVPLCKVSEGTAAHFNYTWEGGQPSAIRVSRIVSETFRQGLPDVHWFVMGDDDTIFFLDNLVRVLSKYDHRQLFYVGHNSESQRQNILHSFGMAFGGGGYAISYPLAKRMEKMQDRCLHRYPHVYGSDSRIQACVAELGVPLTREPGFHQVDLRGDLFGYLAAHPVTPLVSLHHLDAVDPIFPKKDRLEGLKHLMKAGEADPGGILQQSICYEEEIGLSISVSSGYVVQVLRGYHTPVELQTPVATYLTWRTGKADETEFTFNTRSLPKDPCEKPTVFFLESVQIKSRKKTLMTYVRHDKWKKDCGNPIAIESVQVFKEQQDDSWIQAPRRQCCENVSPASFSETGRLVVKVRSCKEGEIIAAD